MTPGHTHHRKSQGPEGQFDLLPPRTPLGPLAAGTPAPHLAVVFRTWERVEPEGGLQHLCSHRYAGRQCALARRPAHSRPGAALRLCSALAPRRLRHGLGAAPGNSPIPPSPWGVAAAAGPPTDPQPLGGGSRQGCWPRFPTRTPGALAGGTLVLYSFTSGRGCGHPGAGADVSCSASHPVQALSPVSPHSVLRLRVPRAVTVSAV